MSTRGWRIEGNHIQSQRTTEGSFAGKACLKIVATGSADTRVNRIDRDTPDMPSGVYNVRIAVWWLGATALIHFSGFGQGGEFQHTHAIRRPANPGTPGVRNSVAVDKLGPVVDGVEHTPAVPGSVEAVVVRARISDPARRDCRRDISAR